MVWTIVFSIEKRTILELDEAMVWADVELPVLEHDELAAVPALLCPAAAVALVLRQAALRSGFQDSEDYRGGVGRSAWIWVFRSLKRRVRA